MNRKYENGQRVVVALEEGEYAATVEMTMGNLPGHMYQVRVQEPLFKVSDMRDRDDQIVIHENKMRILASDPNLAVDIERSVSQIIILRRQMAQEYAKIERAMKLDGQPWYVLESLKTLETITTRPNHAELYSLLGAWSDYAIERAKKK